MQPSVANPRSSIDFADGWLRNRHGVPWVGPGYVRGLIDLTYSSGRFTGSYLDEQSDMQPQGTDHIRTFVFNTRDRSIRTADTGEKSAFGAQQTKVHVDAASYWRLYDNYRHSWPTAIFWLLLLGGETLIVLFIPRLERRTASPANAD